MILHIYKCLYILLASQEIVCPILGVGDVSESHVAIANCALERKLLAIIVLEELPIRNSLDSL